MLKNYLKIAVRSLLKFKGYALINLVGLALGLSAGILIMIYVLDEISYDNFHTKADRIYRVNTVFISGDSGSEGANETNGWPIGKILETDFPEVESVLYTRSAPLMVNQEDKKIREKMFFASPEFFNIFSFPILKGNSTGLLNEPYTVVISEAMEQKYFPGEDALNKTLVMSDTLNFKITGIMKNMPSQSHIQADMLVSFSTFQALNPSFSFSDGWGNINMRNYILLKENVNFDAFAAKSKNLYMERAGEMMKSWGVTAFVSYEPLNRIYLYSKSGNGMGPLGSIDRVYLLTGIAFFSILLACINFINLATARSVYRAKEVGLRKVVGSTRKSLMTQFLSESFVVTLVACVLSIGIVVLVMPWFNLMIGKSYQLPVLTQPSVIIGISILLLMITFMAGYYPALVLSALKPTDTLKGKLQSSARGIQLRRMLVIFQFAISVCLVSGTWIVLDQLAFMQHQNLGFNKDQVIIINGARLGAFGDQALLTFKDRINTLASVEEVSYANAYPSRSGWEGQVAYPDGQSADKAVSVEYIAVDDKYLDILNLQLIAGRNFDQKRELDLKEGLVLNESAVAVFGWSSAEEAIGKKITSPSGTPAGEVIGVVKDYHQKGLQHKVGPITMDYAPEYSYLYLVKYKAANTQDLIGSLKSLWNSSFAGYDFDYHFLDESFGKQYQAEERLANVFQVFAVVTLIIAGIGLLGLVSFMIVARTKEIGVRKVLGANALNIAVLLTKEFVVLIIMANVLAIPLVWYFAENWLNMFAFRTSLDPLLFIGTMSIALVATLFVVGGQTLRAARANPVQSLRSE